MPSLRLVTWSCNYGSLHTCLSELAEYSPDIVFLQRCALPKSLPLVRQFLTRRIGAKKGIALGSRNTDFHLAQLEPRANSGPTALPAAVTGFVSFTALGIWAQGPNYVDDVMQTLDAYDDDLRAGMSVVMGHLDSGTNRKTAQSPSHGYERIMARLADLTLVSAYDSFNVVGHETHPTCPHLFRSSEPWHIDFCFVPARWVMSLVGVTVIDNRKWTMRSDHLPLKVDLRFFPPRD